MSHSGYRCSTDSFFLPRTDTLDLRNSWSEKINNVIYTESRPVSTPCHPN